MVEAGGLPPPPPPAGGPPDNRERHNRQEDDEDGYPRQVGNYHIFLAELETKHSKRRREAEVNAIVPPIPQYLNWSEQEIIWSRKDQPDVLPHPGNYAMILDPIIVSKKHSCRFSRVLVDGGTLD